jgi:hypothetical protein
LLFSVNNIVAFLVAVNYYFAKNCLAMVRGP